MSREKIRLTAVEKLKALNILKRNNFNLEETAKECGLSVTYIERNLLRDHVLISSLATHMNAKDAAEFRKHVTEMRTFKRMKKVDGITKQEVVYNTEEMFVTICDDVKIKIVEKINELIPFCRVQDIKNLSDTLKAIQEVQVSAQGASGLILAKDGGSPVSTTYQQINNYFLGKIKQVDEILSTKLIENVITEIHHTDVGDSEE
jgi:nitrate reductase NapAB chaperone NapD